MSTTPAPAGPGGSPEPPAGGYSAGAMPGGGSGFSPGAGAPGPPGPAGSAAPPAAGAGRRTTRPTVTVATYETYAEAQRAVDYLSDNGFPVQHTAIIGTDLRLVETVTGRLTIARAAV